MASLGTFGPFSRADRRSPTASLRAEMPTRQAAVLPLHDFLAELENWRLDANGRGIEHLRQSLAALEDAYGVRGVHLRLIAPPLPELLLAAGTLAGAANGGQ